MLWMSSCRSRSQSEETGERGEYEMSLCYDFSKWTMITLASIAISLTVGLLLINFAHGQEEENTDREDKAAFYLSIVPKEKLSYLFEYCANHSSLTGNVFMPVPEHVTCDDVKLEKINRGMDSLLTKLENMSQKELQENWMI
jgi:hypothetical protein